MNTSTAPIISIVIPCYNEELALPTTAKVLLELLDKMSKDGLISPLSYVLCCNDGSKDNTWGIIETLHNKDNRIKGISLAHNRGHQYVLLAGLMTAMDKCDAAISIDADLQDDPNAIIEMVEEFSNGAEIIYGVRSSRTSDTWFKRTSAHAFYSFQKSMGLDTVYDHADYRLMSNPFFRTKLRNRKVSELFYFLSLSSTCRVVLLCVLFLSSLNSLFYRVKPSFFKNFHFLTKNPKKALVKRRKSVKIIDVTRGSGGIGRRARLRA